MKQEYARAFVNPLEHVAIRSRKADEALMDRLLDLLAEKVAQRIQPVTAARRKLLVTLKEAGEMIGRSPGAVGQLVKRGELRGVVCGRRIHVQVKEIEDWIERCATR